MIRESELEWFKSSYSSGPEGDSCVEVAWRKSSYSSSSDINDCVEVGWAKSSHSDSDDINDCVEVASTPAAVLVRDSKDTAIPHLSFSPAAWAGFVAGAAHAS
ncbi:MULTISPECIES: DUF397 domain-containing protein [Streptomyces]|uniref:DUF397 domain-containing protein n=1 Tax=Streptomyces TaxID=1883 RepID=UPI00167620E4|nr:MULTISPECIES: DUF397 domain-containing protein [Streptomyces]MBD3579144.1 DUF397 domain-containing protein [Streptomyces sp. KD18]GGT00066.1 toxin [Streptomyces toxytricini]